MKPLVQKINGFLFEKIIDIFRFSVSMYERLRCTVSSAAEHHVYTVAVGGSNPSPCTNFEERKNMEIDVDNEILFEYVKNKKMREQYPSYAYYKAIMTVADEILPQPETKYLDLLGVH